MRAHSSLRNKRILVTGGAGFLGSSVVAKLKKRGCQNTFVPRSCEFDLRKKSAVARLFKEAKPEIVIHLAAVVGGVGANDQNPGTFFYDNAMMGLLLLEGARKAKVQKFVAVGTVCSYPTNTPVPFREENLWDGYPEETNAAYGLAKKMLLVQAQAYRKQFGMNSIYLLPANLYGPGDKFELETCHVIPAIVRKCIEARENGVDEVVLWGDGSPTREFLYVEEAAEAILLATEKYHGEQPVNIGSGQEISVEKLAELIAELTGFQGTILWDKSRPNGQLRRRLDVTKAKDLFGFASVTSLEAGLRETIRWFESNRGFLDIVERGRSVPRSPILVHSP